MAGCAGKLPIRHTHLQIQILTAFSAIVYRYRCLQASPHTPHRNRNTCQERTSPHTLVLPKNCKPLRFTCKALHIPDPGMGDFRIFPSAA